MYESLHAWLIAHPTVLGIPFWVFVLGVSIISAIFSIVFTAIAIVAIPANYFCGPSAPDWTSHRHPLVRWLLRIIRNVLGWVLIIAGVLLSLPGVPGQGILTILIGLMLVEFPGKRTLERKIVRMPRVRRSVDAIRQRFGAMPLELDESEA